MSKREKVYVVDKDDNILEEKWRDETTPEDRIRIVSVWVENSKGEVLLARRAETMRLHPGLWGPSAAGGVTVGEDYLISAKKELSEELGLDIDKEGIAIIRVGKYLYGTNAPNDGLRMLAVFLVKVNWQIQQFTYPEDEVAEIKWIAKANLKRELRSKPDTYLPHAGDWEQYLFS
jgi:isopentenyldiphosphate isomerase